MATKKGETKLATEAYINGANPLTGGEVNANLESGEYVKFPEGSIAEVLGKRHTNGGVDLSLPEYTQVLSDTKDLKITKEDVKKVKEFLDLKNVSTKNTYSDVIDKYARKIGYKEILKEQEELFKKAEKYVFDVEDENTAKYNRQTYSKKIQESEDKRQGKEKELSMVFDVLFDLQEDQKGTPQEDREVPQEVREQQMTEDLENSTDQIEQASQSMEIEVEQPQEVTSDFSQEEMMKYGGQLREIETISKGMGVAPRTIFEKLKKQGKVKEFALGGMTGEPENTVGIDPKDVNRIKTKEIADYMSKINGAQYDMYNPQDIDRVTQDARGFLDASGIKYNIGEGDKVRLEDLLSNINDYSTRVSNMQETFRDYGIYEGEISGVLDDSTVQSYNKFLKKNNYTVSGTGSFEDVFSMPYRRLLSGNANSETVKYNSAVMTSAGAEDSGYTAKYNANKYIKQSKKLGGNIQKFDNGGLFKISQNENKYQNEERVKQSANSTAYGKVDALTAVNQLYKNFPLVFGRTDYEDVFEIKDNKVVIKEGVDFSKESKYIEKLQRDIDKQMKSTAKYALKDENKKLFGAESLTYLQDYLDNETFIETGKKGVRGYDKQLGNFTSGRKSLGLDVVTPEESKKLNELGITTMQQLQSAKPEDIKFLSKGSQGKIKDLGVLPDDVDFSLNTYTPEEPAKVETPPPSTDSTVPNTMGEYTKAGNPPPRMFFEPALGLIPPKGLQAEGLYSSAFSRLDPLRIGIEPQLKMINDTSNQMNRLASDLPQAQRAALAATTLATSQQTEADAITKANMSNAASQSQVDQYNNAQADREQQANNAALQNYEARMLKGLDNTENDVRDYYAAMQAGNYNNLNRQMQLNTLDRMFPDIRLDNFGIAGNYDPKNPLQIQDANKWANKLWKDPSQI